MGLEAATYISELVATNPAGGDERKQGDDHLRLIKGAVKSSFPSISFARYIEQPRVDVADSATPDLWAATSDYANILGTTTKTGFATTANFGQRKLVRFNAAMILTHNVSTLQLPNGASITTVAGDHALIQSEGTTANIVVAYFRKDGRSIVDPIPSQTGNSGKVLTTNGTTLSWQYPAPIGAIFGWMGATPPTGCFELDGSAISRVTYAELFAIFSDDYGVGDGSTTFNLPDFRGEFLRGWAHGSTNDPDKASRTNRGDGVAGDFLGTKQTSAVGPHRHFGLADTGVGDPGSGSPTSGTQAHKDFTGGSSTNHYTMQSSGTDATIARTSDPIAGAGVTTENRPRNVNIMWVVKAL